MSNFENPTWRTAAVLKIIISPYLSRKSSELHEIWYADTNFITGNGNVTKYQKFPNSGWRTDAIWKIILAITRLHRVQLRRNFEFGGIIARTRKFRDENAQSHAYKGLVIKMSNFENPTWQMAAILNIIISPYLEKPQIVRIARNLICSHFNQLLQTSHEDTSLSFNEVTKTIFTKQCPRVRSVHVTAQLVVQVVSNVVHMPML